MNEADVQTAITVDVNIDLSDQVIELLSGFLTLYKEPKFLACIILAFLAAQFVHVVLRASIPNMRRVWVAIGVWTAHVTVGAVLAHQLLQHMTDMEFYKYFTGANSIVLYYGLVWISTKWFKWPAVARWLSLRDTKVTVVDSKPQIQFGDTITFISGKAPRRK